jgi:hypothetical protein
MKRLTVALLLITTLAAPSFANDQSSPNFKLERDIVGLVYGLLFDYNYRLGIKYTDDDGTRVIINDVIINDTRKCFDGHYYRYHIPATLGTGEVLWLPIDCDPKKILIETNKGTSIYGFGN